jgi:tetratricopeptide (TPR) repeat protein
MFKFPVFNWFSSFLFACLVVSPYIYGEQPRICLALNINNDHDKLLTCLQSVKGHIDCISICDFGSDRDTKDVINQFTKTNKIPCQIYDCESKSYLENVTTCADSAKKTLRAVGFPLNNSYILFLEPNQVISSDTKINVNSLNEDSYSILERSNDLAYYTYKPNLLRASLPPETITDIRENSFSNHGLLPAKLRTLRLEEFSTYSKETTSEEIKSKVIERSEKNVELFSQAVKDYPDNERYLLCLAQAYKALKNYDEAIICYKIRIEKKGNPEEVWYSKLMIGECYEEMDNWHEALCAYLTAYEYAPYRAESIKKIASYYRKAGLNDTAYIFAKHGPRIPYLDNQTLFPLPALYDYEFDDELSIIAYYTRFRGEGYGAISDLLLKKDAPDWVKDQGYRNILFYTEHLRAESQKIKIDLPMVEGKEQRTYNPMNPSIVKTDDGYTLICRAVNYTQTGAKHFHTPDPDGIFRTKNFLVYYDKDFNVLSQHEIIDNLQREKLNSFCIEGLEDCRIVNLQGETWFTATTFDTNPSGAIQISLAKLNGQELANNEIAYLETLIPLQGPDPHRCEKNWLPFAKDGELYILYNSAPFTIFQPNFETGDCSTVFEYTAEHDFSKFRGSAAPIPFDEGYLLLIHEVALLPDNTRVYLHRFVYLSKEFEISLVSKPFTFNHQGVEFCLSMTIDHSGSKLIMPIGIEDREALLLTVDLKDVRAMLEPLPTTYKPF